MAEQFVVDRHRGLMIKGLRCGEIGVCRHDVSCATVEVQRMRDGGVSELRTPPSQKAF